MPSSELFQRGVLWDRNLNLSLKRVHTGEEHMGVWGGPFRILLWRSPVQLIVKSFFLNDVLGLHSEPEVALIVWIPYSRQVPLLHAFLHGYGLEGAHLASLHCVDSHLSSGMFGGRYFSGTLGFIASLQGIAKLIGQAFLLPAVTFGLFKNFFLVVFFHNNPGTQTVPGKLLIL